MVSQSNPEPSTAVGLDREPAPRIAHIGITGGLPWLPGIYMDLGDPTNSDFDPLSCAVSGLMLSYPHSLESLSVSFSLLLKNIF